MSLHPVFAEALAPFIAPRKPLRIKPTQSFQYVLNGVDLICQIDFESEEKQTRDEPGWPATATFEGACTNEGRIDVSGLITEDFAAEIEGAFLQQTEAY